MAIIKMIPIGHAARRKASRHLEAAIKYISNPDKTDKGELVSGINCVPERAYGQMKATKEIYGKEDGRQGYHIIISFKENEAGSESVEKFARDFAGRYLKDEYEAVVAVHNNTGFPHAHIVFNSVNMMTGHKYYCPKGEMEKVIRPLVDQMCVEYGLQKVPQREKDEKGSPICYWNEHHDGPFVWTQMIQRDVDGCIDRAIKDNGSFFDFIRMLKGLGYEVRHGKYLAVRPRGMKRFRRLYQLGEEYTEAAIRERISKRAVLHAREAEADGREKNKAAGLKELPLVSYHAGRIKGLKKLYLFETYQIVEIRRQAYSSAWKYREEIKKFETLKRQYEILCREDICTERELDDVISANARKEAWLLKKRRILYGRKKSGRISNVEEYEKALGSLGEQIKETRKLKEAALQIKKDIHQKDRDYEVDPMEIGNHLGKWKSSSRQKSR